MIEPDDDALLEVHFADGRLDWRDSYSNNLLALISGALCLPSRRKTFPLNIKWLDEPNSPGNKYK